MAEFYWKSITVAVCSVGAAVAQTTVLYETKFEPSEGYDINKDLAGQRGWLGQGSGGNGLINGQFIGLGQQGYVGFSLPMDTNATTSVWQPVNFDPATAGNPLVKFSTTFQIIPSTKGTRDDFRWSIYNLNGDRLFSLDFESENANVSYILEDGKFLPTGSTIAFDGFYDLNVWMDFRRNQWTAFLNDYLLVNSEKITLNNSALNFGDADAVWLPQSVSGAGDNFMAFDNYRVTAEALTAIPGFVEAVGMTNGLFNFTVFGEKGVKYSVDVTTDFTKWLSLGEYDNPDGAFNFQDTTSKGVPHSFYRLRPVP